MGISLLISVRRREEEEEIFHHQEQRHDEDNIDCIYITIHRFFPQKQILVIHFSLPILFSLSHSSYQIDMTRTSDFNETTSKCSPLFQEKNNSSCKRLEQRKISSLLCFSH